MSNVEKLNCYPTCHLLITWLFVDAIWFKWRRRFNFFHLTPRIEIYLYFLSLSCQFACTITNSKSLWRRLISTLSTPIAKLTLRKSLGFRSPLYTRTVPSRGNGPLLPLTAKCSAHDLKGRQSCWCWDLSRIFRSTHHDCMALTYLCRIILWWCAPIMFIRCFCLFNKWSCPRDMGR